MVSANFSTFGAASIHEARCRLKVGEKPAFECRKCGMRLPRHFGMAKRMAHEQYCLGSVVAGPAEIAVSCLFTCRPVCYMNAFAPTLGQRQKVLFIGFATVGLKFGYLTPLLAGIGRVLNISNTST